MYPKRCTVGVAAVLLFAVLLGWDAQASALTREDQSAIRAVVEAYRNGWLNGDADAVMATLTPDAVLQPSGLAPLAGEEAIRAFWWPAAGPVTNVLAMELHIEEIGGEDQLAFARGRGSLTFSYQDDGVLQTVSAKSTFLNILKKGADGRWRISHRMWSDLPRE